MLFAVRLWIGAVFGFWDFRPPLESEDADSGASTSQGRGNMMCICRSRGNPNVPASDPKEATNASPTTQESKR
ncbi:hypothetical protein L596_014385 [Steinernema carpocapsae]|uniref:Uncharacterized protein n=1 Tax=Steinernema carpocapsae TaxID=34508 RepID=A0A4U5NBS6_STECR|nr:hypothetical protein L596_014385 [Steinernema carpocapsae]